MTAIDLIAAAAARVVALVSLDDTRDPGAVQAHRSHVAVIPAMGDLMPRPTGDRAPDVAVPDGEAGTATPGVPEAGVTACGCGRPVLHVCVADHGRWPRHGTGTCLAGGTAVLDATPTRYGRWELRDSCSRGARAVAVDPALAIRPTYALHRCQQAVAA